MLLFANLWKESLDHVLKMENFKLNRKKANVAPAHKIGDKQNLKNYRPISLLPVTMNYLQKII